MGYISKNGLINLANWKYTGAPYTPLELLMNPYWEWCASKVPATIAPNLVTLSGLFFTITAVVACLVYDSTFEGDIPTFVHILGAFSVFCF